MLSAFNLVPLSMAAGEAVDRNTRAMFLIAPLIGILAVPSSQSLRTGCSFAEIPPHLSV